jgi:cell division protein FtsL
LARAAESAVHEEPALPERPQTERHLRLVEDREARRKTNRRHAAVTVAIAGIAVVCLALVALHVLIAENQFRLDGLQQQAAVQQAHYEKLRLLVAELEAPARIVSVAEGRLGMRAPASVTYLPATSTPGSATSALPALAPASAKTASAKTASAKTTGAKKNGRTVGRAPADPPPGAVWNGTVAAPQGDADWPSIKQYLSGSP